MTADQDKGETPTAVLAVCINNRFSSDRPSCGPSGGAALADALEAGIRERGLAVKVDRVVCFGACYKGPNVRLVPGGAFYHRAGQDQIEAILQEAEERCGFVDDSDSNILTPVAPGT